MVLGAVVGLATLVGASAHPSAPAAALARRVPAHTRALAARVTGAWTGSRVDSGSTAPHQFTMTWKQAPDGQLTGRVALAHGPTYTTRIVWSSDTAFITESAPHRSPELKESVVARSVTRFKGDSLVGQFELRPMSYAGHTLSGHFAAARKR